MPSAQFPAPSAQKNGVPVLGSGQSLARRAAVNRASLAEANLSSAAGSRAVSSQPAKSSEI
ncbi:MAG: hypothetical protein KME26_28050 [Oscillatoria princeps RMCB-10]|nr:hypothetical protein [Oscillatoria princeps RMCB-10]